MIKKPSLPALSFLLAAVVTLLAPAVAEAYVGPGAGFAFITSFFLLLSTFLLALFALLSWPVRLVIRLLRWRRPPLPPRARRVVVIGLDGLDPETVRELMGRGLLPQMKGLAEKGCLSELATTCPSMSPVAWSTFATGVDPSRHGIFDFLTRDRRTYNIVLSSTEIRPPRRALNLGSLRIPLGKPKIRLLQRSEPFWHILGRHGLRSSILRVPITFPPRKFFGTLLSAMCAPDLLGTQGSFSFYTSQQDQAERMVGRVYPVEVHDNLVESRLWGPPDPLRREERPLSTPLQVTLQPGRQGARLKVGRQRVDLKKGEYSDWVEVEFPLVAWLKLRGICRFRLGSLDPFELYVTPINISPDRPSMPLSHPLTFSVFLSKLLGRYSTLGLAEDTWALNEDVLDKQGFLQQAMLYQAEREQMFSELLRRQRRGLCACVFDGTDRIQHMFMQDHQRGEGEHAGAIEDIYTHCDAMLERVLQEVDADDPQTLLLVISDHGFAPFTRGVNLNTWLMEQGYLVLEKGRREMGEYLQGVDWARTRAYALGLSGIFLNLKGREARGCVTPKAAASLRAEIAGRLASLEDPEGPGRPIRKVFDVHTLYDGPYLEDAPDLIVGYNRGYRASWNTAKGMAGQRVLEDNTKHWNGDHCIDPLQVPGVLLSNQPLSTDGAALADLAPTILEAFGVAKPPHMRGRSLLPTREYDSSR